MWNMTALSWEMDAMRRREFLALCGAALTTSAVAQRPARRIGFLSNYSEAAGKKLVGCFTAELARSGWAEGHGLSVEYRWMAGQPQSADRLAEELVRLHLDLIAANSTQAAQALRKSTRPDGVPIVFMSVSDPVASGVVESIPRPGANITGISNFFPASSAKLLEYIRMIAPAANRIEIVRDPGNPGKTLDATAIRESAKSIPVALTERPVRNATDIEAMFSRSGSQQPHAFIVLVDGVTLTHRDLIVGLINESRIPAIYQVRDFVEGGGLVSYGLNFCQHFARAATYANRILRGTKPAELPVEFPSTFELVVNLDTARRTAIEISSTLLALASEVIE